MLVVLRTPPDGALYHQGLEGRFDELLDLASESPDVGHRAAAARPRAGGTLRRIARGCHSVPGLDAPSLLASADVVIGAGGTMARESAILGMPTYTVFAGRLAAVDGELLRLGRLQDLRAPGTMPRLERRPATAAPFPPEHADEILRVISSTVADVAS